MGSQSMSHHLSLKKKLKSTFCITGCFRTTNHPHDLPEQPSSPTTPTERSTQSPRGVIKTKSPRLTRTLSKSHEKCKNLIHRIGGVGGVGGGVSGHGKHIRRHTTDFHYDPSSYALNFDRGDEDDNVNRFPLRNFSARLPRSPPSSATATEFTIHNLLR
ncbi:hypothetical protein EUTSA_v10005689mg [Eutrema salsugineum]|uniref:Uncharacterized protein n=1 Tax=Eutrema salsugineum TaxID=72664 RepID=V4KPN0_EUTSA|nr:uncharacterized protein LOC18013467 [Eutrema salsugineum]ESQ33259.1 hypothetical protein EUTSA_v10005689mg [Eutrema salsugineum]